MYLGRLVIPLLLLLRPNLAENGDDLNISHGNSGENIGKTTSDSSTKNICGHGEIETPDFDCRGNTEKVEESEAGGRKQEIFITFSPKYTAVNASVSIIGTILNLFFFAQI